MKDVSSSGLLTPFTVSVSHQFTQYHKIHSGEFNLIYRAQSDGKWFILKGLQKEFREDSAYRSLLKKEYEIGRQLHHPHIVETISWREDDQIGECIVLEYVEGGSLTDFLKKKKPMSVRVKIATQILDAMNYFHKKQIIHRDLKPSNILITKNGDNVKIIDFGLADGDMFAILKQAAGTPKYMAPELLNGGQAADCRADIYAFGLMLKQLGPHYLPWKRIVRKCTSPKREQRYHSAADISQSLHRRPIVFTIVFSLLALSLCILPFLNYFQDQKIVSERAPASKRKITKVDGTLDGKPCPEFPTVTDVDGNTYTTVQLGCQCWMRENLRVTRYADRESIPLGTDTNSFMRYRYFPNHSAELVPTFGYLYNWLAAMGHSKSSMENPSGVQGICPDGWHLPSDAEWGELERYLIGSEKYASDDNAEHIGKALASKEY